MGHLCPVKISISAEHSIAIAMRLSAFRRLSPAGERGFCSAHEREQPPVAEQMDREVYSWNLGSRKTRKVARRSASNARESFAAATSRQSVSNIMLAGVEGRDGEGRGGTWPYHQLRDEYRSIMPGIFYRPPTRWFSHPDHRSKVRALSHN